MGMLYRQDIFDKHGIAVPTTWDEFADAARKLHAADPNVYLTNLPPNEPGVARACCGRPAPVRSRSTPTRT